MYNDGTVPIAVLDTQFGNTEQVRRKHYTDASDLSALGQAADRFQTDPDDANGTHKSTHKLPDFPSPSSTRTDRETS